MRSVVVVGASLAGLRAAETLREEGFDGSITLVGEEPHAPYDRPPLSKAVLAGEWEPDRIGLPAGRADREPDLGLDWRLGRRAVALDLAARSVALDDGSQVGFDGLVIATGSIPRRLPFGHDRPGVHVLRSLDDCLALRADLDAGPQRVVVVGAGFIGGEVADSCRRRGLDVTLVEALPIPLAAALGPEVGASIGELHGDHGVDLRLGTGVTGFEGGLRVEQVQLTDGSTVAADVVVVGVGVRPATDWLADSGLALDDGVVCDETCLAAPGVAAAGDVARWPNRVFGGEAMRVEHWENALDQGGHAARRLLASGSGEAYAPVPWFWSDLYEHKLTLAGRPRPGDDVRVVEGSLAERRFVALYGRAGRVFAVAALDRPAAVMRYRARIAAGLGWDDALAEIEASA